MGAGDYWRHQAAIATYAQTRDAEAVSAEIAELYRTAYNQIAYNMRGIFGAFTGKHRLTDKEAMRILNQLDDPTDLKAMRRILQQQGTNAAAEAAAMLDAPEYKRKLARLQSLMEQTKDISRRLYRQDMAKQRAWYTGLCSDAYYHAIYATQREVGFQFSFNHIDDKLIRSIMETPWDGAGFSTRLWNNVSGVAREVQKQIAWGYITGKTEQRMAKELANKYAAGAFESRRLIRTQSSYVSNEAQMRAYEECSAEQYQYVATLDTHTDGGCGALDRLIFLVSARRPGLNCPPMHPFCRCTTKIYIDQSTRAELKRRARDPVTGRNKLVPASVSYTEWAKQNGITPRK